MKSNVAVGRGLTGGELGEGWIESKPCHGAAKMFILEWDLPIINSCLQLFYASITSVLALLVSSKLVAIVQLLLDENQKIIAHGFHWFKPKVKGAIS